MRPVILIVLVVCGMVPSAFSSDLPDSTLQKITLFEVIRKGGTTEQMTTEAANFGITQEVKLLSFEVRNTGQESTELYGYIDNPLLDNVVVFKRGERAPLLINGETFPFTSRPLGLPGYAFKFEVKPQEKADLYMALSSGEQIVVPVIVGSKTAIQGEIIQREILYSIYFGIILVMIIYNLFVYLSVRDRVYVYYVFYILTVGATQLVIGGFANKYFWPTSPVLSVLASSLVPVLSGLGTVVFARSFIRTPLYAPKIDLLLKFYFMAYLVSATLALMGMHVYSQWIINFNAASALILVIAAFKAIRAGYRPAKFFLAAFTLFLFGVTVYALRNFGFLGYNTFTSFALPIGSALETVLLSFALADRINQFKKEKEESQQQAIAVMKENELLITEQNVRLEQMVHERTLDLEKANDDLSTTLNDLRITQKQLVESEKLASLGQMTAGIAHEINNPINFVQSNVQPLRRDIDDMLSLLDEFARLENDAAISDKVATLHKRYHELDMPYVRDEVKQLLHGIEEGSRRTAEIVRGLRVFSRMDRDSLVSASVNDCIQSTLIVMKNITKGAVTLEIELDTTMPAIYCFPGKLNQVFMNILNNAVHATDMPGRKESDRLIRIHSAHDDATVRVIITDNGTGIAESIRSRIFDPFFTTKNVGEGTGLGLSIALGIVEEHKGHIEVHSEEGKGTTVIVSLPRLVDIDTA